MTRRFLDEVGESALLQAVALGFQAVCYAVAVAAGAAWLIG